MKLKDKSLVTTTSNPTRQKSKESKKHGKQRKRKKQSMVASSSVYPPVQINHENVVASIRHKKETGSFAEEDYTDTLSSARVSQSAIVGQ